MPSGPKRGPERQERRAAIRQRRKAKRQQRHVDRTRPAGMWRKVAHVLALATWQSQVRLRRTDYRARRRAAAVEAARIAKAKQFVGTLADLLGGGL